MSAPPPKRAKRSASASSGDAQPGGSSAPLPASYLPSAGHTEMFPEHGVNAAAGVIGMHLPMCIMPMNNHKLAPITFIGSGRPGTDNGYRLSLYLWLIHCAWSADVTVYVESVIDWASYVALEEVMQLRTRLFIPLTFDNVQPLLGVMRRSLEPEGTDAAGGGAAFVPVSAGLELINSVEAFLRAHELSMGCVARDRPSTLSYDTMPTAAFTHDDVVADAGALGGYVSSSDDDEDNGDEVVGGSESPHSGGTVEAAAAVRQAASPLVMLNAELMFNDALTQADRENGAHESQLGKAAYMHDGKLFFPPFTRYESGGMLYTMRPNLNGVVSCANQLLAFTWPLSRPSVPELLSSYAHRLAYSGQSLTPDMLEARTAGELEIAVAQHNEERGMRPDQTMRASVIPADPFPDLVGGGQYDQAHRMIAPIQYTMMQRCGMLMRRLRQSIKDQKIEPEEAQRVAATLLRGAEMVTQGPTDGVNPSWHRLEEDKRRLSADIESPYATGPSQIARRIFRYIPTSTKEGLRMPPLSGMMVQMAECGMRLNMTLAQVQAWMAIWKSGAGLLWNRYGLLAAWIIIGPPDTGKSEMASRVIKCAPPSLVRQAHQESAKVTTHNQTIGFKWKDEQDLNIAKGKKGQAAGQQALMDLAVSALGYGAYTRFRIGDRAKGLADDVQTVMSEQRCIEISASNEHLGKAKESRAHVATMYNVYNSGVSTPAYPTRQERTLLPRDSAEIQGTSSALQLIMCYANLGWRAQAFGAQLQSIIPLMAVRIFNGMVNAMLVPEGFPSVKCRDLNKLQTHAAAIMQFRVSRAWESDTTKSVAERDQHRDTHFLAKGVISFSDVLLAWMELSSMSDTKHEEALLLSTFKAAIKVDEGMLDLKLLEYENNKQYYLTSIRGVDGLSHQCPSLGEGIINTIIGKLRYPAEGKPIIVAADTGDSRGLYAVLKSAVNAPQCTTPTQKKIIAFLCKVVQQPSTSGQRYWYPIVDSQGDETNEVAFTMAIRDAMLRPAMSAVFPGWAGSSTALEDIKLAFSMFVSAGVMSEVDDTGASMSANVHSPISIPTQPNRTAAAGGLLDPQTVFTGQADYDALPTNAVIAASTRAAWAETMDRLDSASPVLTPAQPPPVTTLTMHSVLVVTLKDLPELRHAIEAHKHTVCNMRPPPTMTYEDRMDSLLQDFVSMTMAVSGEASPGDWVYTGVSTLQGRGDARSSSICKGIVIKPYNRPITIDNPRRGHRTNDDMVMGPPESDEATNTQEVDPEEEFLPAGRETVTFYPGDNLYERMLQINTAHNAPWLAA